MGWAATTVETDHGEMLNVWTPNGGGNGGKSVLNFLLGLQHYCDQTKSPIDLVWISKYEKTANLSLCSIAQPLLQSLLEGDQRDRLSTYENHRLSYPPEQHTEQQFLKEVERMENTWVPVDKLLTATEELLKAFRDAKPEAEEPWYDPEWTPADFQALYETLKIFAERGAENARILIF